MVRQYRPQKSLEQTVDAFWVHASAPGFRADASSPVSKAPRVYPDGCIDLIFRARRSPDGRLSDAELFVAGVATAAYDVEVAPETCFVGVRFRPGMSRLAIDASPSELANHDTPAVEIDQHYGRLFDRLTACTDVDAMVRELQVEIIHHTLCSAGRPPRRVREAISLLGCLDRDGHEIGQIARSIGVAERTLYRDVLAWTGLAPRMLARVLRFQAALGSIQSDANARLASVAQHAGYADQAHMTREFRTFAGQPPSAVGAGN